MFIHSWSLWSKSTRIDSHLTLCTFTGCPEGFIQSGSSCFWVSDYALEWPEARIACEDMNAQLALIKTAEKQDEMESFFEENGYPTDIQGIKSFQCNFPILIMFGFDLFNQLTATL